MEKVLVFQRKFLWKIFKAQMEEVYGPYWRQVNPNHALKPQWEEFVRYIARWS